MAKKFKQWFRRLNVDYFVGRLYDTGVTQSLIAHVLFLLILSCIISVKDVSRKPICITLSEPEQIVEYTNILEEPTEIVIPETNDQEQEISESIAEIVGDSGANSDIQINIEDMSETQPHDNVDHLLAELDPDQLTEEIIVEKKEPKVKRKYTNNVQQPGNQVGSDFPQGQGVGQGNGGSHEGFGGDLAELDRRLQQLGARTGDIQISLSWNTVDDIDLHVMVLPIRSQINWTNKRGPCGGMLDIDMNAHPQMVSNRPIENIFWPDRQAPQGMYIVGIQNYMPWSRNLRTEVLVVVKIRGKVVHSKKVVAGYGEGVKEVLRFNF